MINFPTVVQNAIAQFSKLPGVGSKSATRQILQMCGWEEVELLNFSEAIHLLSTIRYCKECGLFAEIDICEICQNDMRWESHSICLVESITDAMAIERSNQYKGVYHITGGVLNPLLGIGPEHIHLNELFDRIINKGITTLILALNPSVEGDATCSYIKYELEQRGLNHVNVERIGFGMPMGGSLEHLDAMTIMKALENRKRL